MDTAKLLMLLIFPFHQCLVADEDVKDIVELSTAGLADIDEMG